MIIQEVIIPMSMKQIIKKMIKKINKKSIIPVFENYQTCDFLNDKIVLLIGGTGGIGTAILSKLIGHNCKIIVSGSNEKKLKALEEKYIDDSNISFICFDLQRFDNYELFLSESIAKFGRVDIVIFASGVHTEATKLENVSPLEYDRVLNINLKSPFFIGNMFADYMASSHIQGKICFISSTRGYEPAWTPYGLSKAALNQMIKGLGKKYVSKGIIINGIAPGPTATSLIGYEEGNGIETNETSVGRLVLPEEVADFTIYLVSPSGDLFVGQTIPFGGGRGVFDIR